MAAQQRADSSPVVELLEQRRLLSITLVEGELMIVGNKKNNKIEITIDARTPDQMRITFDGFVRKFFLADVERLNIKAGQGDDYIFIDPGYGKEALNQPTWIYGSGGRDTIISGWGRDRIYGGSGADIVRSHWGRDIIYGEAGADDLDGGHGNDYIDGGRDNDTITGGPGIDRLFGNVGDDTIYSKDGATDEVNGGPDIDSADVDKIDDTVVSIETILNPRR